jgi:hypothetical protein
VELDRPNLRGGDDVSRNPNDEQVAESLIEDDLGRNTRIRTTKDNCERLLPRRQLAAACLVRYWVVAGSAGDEAAISFPKALERFWRLNHHVVRGRVVIRRIRKIEA